MSKDIVILHGTKGSPQGNWFPWLKAEMEQRGHTVYVPKLPTPEGQSKEAWCAALRDQAPMFGDNTILIGHSCGATFILHILEVVRNPVAQAILVSPVIADISNTEYDTLNSTFTHHPFSWSAIQANAKSINILHGDNDPYVPFTQAQTVADKLDATLTIIPQGGHLNAEAGYTKFEKLLEIIQ
ncbi:MAG: alpha/beta hydrolase [Alphaproteobacteria bacterium]